MSKVIMLSGWTPQELHAPEECVEAEQDHGISGGQEERSEVSVMSRVRCIGSLDTSCSVPYWIDEETEILEPVTAEGPIGGEVQGAWPCQDWSASMWWISPKHEFNVFRYRNVKTGEVIWTAPLNSGESPDDFYKRHPELKPGSNPNEGGFTSSNDPLLNAPIDELLDAMPPEEKAKWVVGPTNPKSRTVLFGALGLVSGAIVGVATKDKWSPGSKPWIAGALGGAVGAITGGVLGATLLKPKNEGVPTTAGIGDTCFEIGRVRRFRRK